MEDLLTDDLEEMEDTQKDRYLTFQIDEESYGLQISIVTEIIGIQKITKIPETPEFIMGVINLRGKVIPVMDVRLRFRKPIMDYGDRTCIIVIQMLELTVGLIVDGVSEVMSIPESEIVPPPEYYVMKNRYIKGISKINDGIIMMLDCDRLLNDKEYSEISEAATGRTAEANA